MKFKAQILSEAEQEKVHEVSLRILQEVGVRYLGDRALPLLASHGAKVDWEEKIAHIPAELVEQSLSTVPKSFVLGARNSSFDYPLPAAESRFCIDGTAAFVSDFHSGQRRYGTRKDIEDALRVFQQLDLGVMAWAPTCASDTPAPARALHEFFSMMGSSSKHGQHELHTRAQVPYLVEGLGAVMGTDKPVVAVVSQSMEHNGASFEEWYNTKGRWYDSKFTKEEMQKWDFRNGFNKGDIIFLRGAKDLEKGEVIVFQGVGTTPIIHRVVDIYQRNGETMYQTKGDNNADSYPGLGEVDIKQSQIIGKGSFKIPYAGWVKIAVSNAYNQIFK